MWRIFADYMMRVMKNSICVGRMIGYIMLTFLVLILLLVTLTAYICWKPPMSVVLVPFRMILQIALKYLIIVLCIVGILYFYFGILKRQYSYYGMVLYFVSMLCLILNIISAMRVVTAKSEQVGISYTAIKAGTEREDYSLVEKEDYAKQLGIKQCKVFWDSDSPYKNTCIIYLNYGGWSVQDESFGAQVMKFCQKEGYSFVRLAAEKMEQESVLELTQKTDKAINELLEIEEFEHIYLCGGSAGGHMSLLCANKEAGDENFPVEGIDKIEGIIALYPCVDPCYSYDYFVDNDAQKQGLLGKMGDKIYCSLYQGDTGTFAGETRKLNESIFGVRTDAESYYESTAIINCLNSTDIPILIVQGSYDSMTLVQAVRDFVDELHKRGRTVSYLELPGVEHVFDMLPTVAWERCESEMAGFVRANSF